MADVAKQEQPAETTPAVDQKETTEKPVENNVPPAEADKAKTEETPAKEGKTETAGTIKISVKMYSYYFKYNRPF